MISSCSVDKFKSQLDNHLIKEHCRSSLPAWIQQQCRLWSLLKIVGFWVLGCWWMLCFLFVLWCVGARVWEVWVFCHAYVVCLCASCSSSQCYIMCDLQSGNTGCGCKSHTWDIINSSYHSFSNTCLATSSSRGVHHFNNKSIGSKRHSGAVTVVWQILCIFDCPQH